METKPLLFGLIGFFIGGLIVSVAATTFDRPVEDASYMSMRQMTEALQGKQGDEFDEAFIASMIEHHEGAIEMAKLSADNAKHDEIKKLSQNIISAQDSEIEQMKQWQSDWGYTPSMHNEESAH